VTTRRPLFQFAETHGLQLPHLTEAEEATRRAIDELTPLVEDGTTDDVALVVFGSLARREMTSESDVDWTLLIDGPVDPAHFDSALRLEEELENTRFRRHGREGTFGGFAISHDLVHKIGGGDDSNRNTTQRILLLVESCSIGRDAAYRRVFRSVLHRYITDDWGWVHGRGPAKVPRFLQNDLARYWRTVAVDFAYKRRDRGGKGWALRTVKLRVSRKMTYAAGLLACFSCDLENVLNGAGTDEAPEQVIITHLVDLSQGWDRVWSDLYEPRRRQHTRRARREGIVVDESRDPWDLARFHEVYVGRMHRWGSTPVLPYRFFQQILENGGDRVRFFVARRGDEVLGGHLNFYHRDTVILWYGLCAHHARSMQPDSLLYSTCIRDACERGYHAYNLGASLGRDSLIQFKRSLGGIPRRYTIHRRRTTFARALQAVRRLARAARG